LKERTDEKSEKIVGIADVDAADGGAGAGGAGLDMGLQFFADKRRQQAERNLAAAHGRPRISSLPDAGIPGNSLLAVGAIRVSVRPKAIAGVEGGGWWRQWRHKSYGEASVPKCHESPLRFREVARPAVANHAIREAQVLGAGGLLDAVE